jgi:alkanesulfonate monooxygenase SsuD/methylene tetrahydromethanopterin reductase-like flavin-dependent oxidoreductase (luciferase family)
MQFGVQFFPEISPQQKSAAQYYEESLAIAAEAETLGFSHTRIVEHYFHRYGGYSPNPIVFLAALSQRTKTMRMITGAILPVFGHPLKQAGEIAMLDGLSNGRLDIGMARAFLPHEFQAFGISLDESVARYQEGMEQIALLLERENVTHHGRFHSFENITSLPRPTQTPRPRFYVAATQTPESFEYAGRNGHLLMAIPISPKIKDLVEYYRACWRDAGHPGNGEVMMAFHMFCHEDPHQAREIARTPFDSYFRALNEVTAPWAQGLASKDYRDYDKKSAMREKVTMDRQIETGGAWIGTPDEIATAIHRSIDRLGPFEHASVQINFADLDIAQAHRSMRLFAAEVMPRFADTRPDSKVA